MGLFDWWHCYCQSIHHSSSPVLPPASLLLFFTLLTPIPLWWCYTCLPLSFRSPLDSHCSLFVTFIHCSCPTLTVFPYLGSPLVSLSVKLWVQVDQWVQDGGVWPREPDGGRDGGEFSHVSANTHTNANTHAKKAQLLGLRFNSPWLMLSSDCWCSPWPPFHTVWFTGLGFAFSPSVHV